MMFNGWEGILRTAVMALTSYPALLLILRVSGKRTLAKLNAFDLVVTVALGSTLATILLSKDVALAEGVTAFVCLIALQFAVAWSAIRWRGFEWLVNSDPALLVYQGRFIEEAMRRERITRADILSAMRAQGLSNLNDVGAVVLETQGELTVLAKGACDGAAVRELRSADP